MHSIIISLTLGRMIQAQCITKSKNLYLPRFIDVNDQYKRWDSYVNIEKVNGKEEKDKREEKNEKSESD